MNRYQRELGEGPWTVSAQRGDRGPRRLGLRPNVRSNYDTLKEVISVGYTEEQRREAAAVKPSLRTDEQNRMLQGQQSQAIRNAATEAARQERIYGARK